MDPSPHNARAYGLRVRVSFAATCLLLLTLSEPSLAQNSASPDDDRSVSMDLLPDAEWKRIESSIDLGLSWLSRQQQANGAFSGRNDYEPGTTGLCVMAFLSRGHRPDEGPYGPQLSKAVEFMLKAQKGDGVISVGSQPYYAPYNHGISALIISELYGLTAAKNEARFRTVIQKAMEFSSHRYSQPKLHRDDEGGWRYFRRHRSSDSDLSVTSWNVMFLRSAKNNGFDVDRALIEDALAYMRGLYDPKRRTFRYENHTDDINFNYPRGMAGAGVLSLALAGEHHSEPAQNAALSILRQPFDQYKRPVQGEQYTCYGAFYCSQAMFQMGGKYWREFYPQLSTTLIEAQRGDGSWHVNASHETQISLPYMTSLSILALTPPYQMLPIFQR